MSAADSDALNQASGVPPTTTKDGENPTLVRNELRLLGSTIFAMAGSAPAQVVAIVLALVVVSSDQATILPMAIAAVGLLFIAVAFQRLNMWRQNAGATYEWVCRAISPYAGNMVGWLMVVALAGFLIADVVSVGPVVLGLLGISPNNQAIGAIAIGVLSAALTITAVIGLRPSARLQITVALLEYVILGVFTVWAFIAIFIVHKAGTVGPSAHWVSFTGLGKGMFGASMVLAVSAIAGWDTGIYVNEETERPERNPGLGTVIGVALLGIIFVVTFGIFQGIAPVSAINAHASNAVAFIGQRLGGVAGDRAFSFAAVLSVLATTQVTIIGLARLLYSMSRDRVVPSRLGIISERFRTPAFATALLGGLGIAFGIVDIYLSSVSTAISQVITVSGLLFSLYYAITALAATWYYRRFVTRSLKDAVILGAMPLSGAGLLLWVAYKGAIGLSGTEAYILGGLGIAAVIMTAIAATIYKSPIFKIKTEAATTTEPTINIGAA